jgi:CRISPR/Cas system CMR-associated protein Cmr3 (group 5 of RAMP superfamily)
MTLLEVKPSTKDVDFIIPDLAEYNYLIKILKDLDYEPVTSRGWKRRGDVFIFDLFPGKRIHTTELLESPLERENHRLLKEYSKLYIGILNDYDLIASKLIRGTGVDFEDCLMLMKFRRGDIDIEQLVGHYRELISYDISEARVGVHIDRFIELLKEEKLYD